VQEDGTGDMSNIYVLAGHYGAAQDHAVEIAAESGEMPELLVPKELYRLRGHEEPIVYVCWPTIYDMKEYVPIWEFLQGAEIRRINC